MCVLGQDQRRFLLWAMWATAQGGIYVGPQKKKKTINNNNKQNNLRLQGEGDEGKTDDPRPHNTNCFQINVFHA